MQQLRIAVILAVAVVLQTSLPRIWSSFSYVDLPLIVVVYFALQRNVLQALTIGAIAGIAVDMMGSVGLLGAGSFSKTITAYIIASLSARVMLENPLVRIPVLAGAALVDSGVYVLMNRLLGQPTARPFVQTVSFEIIGTTVAGTLILYLLDRLLSERAHQRRQFAFRRRIARRSAGALRRR
jgi:rod shape-determining protein MreD